MHYRSIMPLYPDESSEQSDRGNENEKAKDGARRIRRADGKEGHRNTNRQKDRVRHNGTSAGYYAARGRAHSGRAARRISDG